ncbi:general transcription factor II-I repeat domain-containing protein 2B-like [Macrobrachium rosenbergii]|uniref:general transcription factor II-I repeat domain-containing protein 2B-like n=1 Tax=Macrobrachium rosenbergii TaxID=79674 RepID=UPI0034D776DC
MGSPSVFPGVAKSSNLKQSGDIKEQVVAAIKESGKFSLQLDESTDVSDDAQLLVYVRYQGKSDIEENFLFCKRLETTTTGEDLFSWLITSSKKRDLNGISATEKDETLISVSQKLKAFKAKLRLWKGKIKLGKTASFPLMNLFSEDEEDASLLDVQSVILGHLEKLIEEFDKYIPDGELHEKYKWLCRPFDVQAEDLSEEESSIQNLQEELIEVQHDETLRFNFERQTLGVFLKKEKPVLDARL